MRVKVENYYSKRNEAIRRYYNEKRKEKNPSFIIKSDLAQLYNLSIKAIESILYTSKH